MESGIYVVEEKGSGNRELVRIRRGFTEEHDTVLMYSDLDAHWTLADVVEYYSFVCRLDLNSFVTDSTLKVLEIEQ
jgi:hypothetical protein